MQAIITQLQQLGTWSPWTPIMWVLLSKKVSKIKIQEYQSLQWWKRKIKEQEVERRLSKFKIVIPIESPHYI